MLSTKYLRNTHLKVDDASLPGPRYSSTALFMASAVSAQSLSSEFLSYPRKIFDPSSRQITGPAGAPHLASMRFSMFACAVQVERGSETKWAEYLLTQPSEEPKVVTVAVVVAVDVTVVEVVLVGEVVTDVVVVKDVVTVVLVVCVVVPDVLVVRVVVSVVVVVTEVVNVVLVVGLVVCEEVPVEVPEVVSVVVAVLVVNSCGIAVTVSPLIVTFASPSLKRSTTGPTS